MTILETFIKLRDDIKTWVTNNLRVKAQTDLSNVSNEDFNNKIKDSGILENSEINELFIFTGSVDSSTGEANIGETTFNDIQEAYNSGKTVILNVQNVHIEDGVQVDLLIPLTALIPDLQAMFFTVLNDTNYGISSVAVVVGADNSILFSIPQIVSTAMVSDTVIYSPDVIPNSSAVYQYVTDNTQILTEDINKVKKELEENTFVLTLTVSSWNDGAEVSFDKNINDVINAINDNKRIIIITETGYFECIEFVVNDQRIELFCISSPGKYNLEFSYNIEEQIWHQYLTETIQGKSIGTINETKSDIDNYPNEVAIINYVNDKIGDIETALDNIISKYGLGGDSV